MSEPIDITFNIHRDKRMRCPECNHILPISPETECDRCGAWIKVKTEVVAPAQDP